MLLIAVRVMLVVEVAWAGVETARQPTAGLAAWHDENIFKECNMAVLCN